MFEKASRIKLCFKTDVGFCSTEDLWDFPLTSRNGLCLDNLARHINKELKNIEEESFVIEKENLHDEILELKLGIVKYIIKYKLKEKDKNEREMIRKDKERKIYAILADKEIDSLKNKSAEDLKEMLNDL